MVNNFNSDFCDRPVLFWKTPGSRIQVRHEFRSINRDLDRAAHCSPVAEPRKSMSSSKQQDPLHACGWLSAKCEAGVVPWIPDLDIRKKTQIRYQHKHRIRSVQQVQIPLGISICRQPKAKLVAD